MFPKLNTEPYPSSLIIYFHINWSSISTFPSHVKNLKCYKMKVSNTSNLIVSISLLEFDSYCPTSVYIYVRLRWLDIAIPTVKYLFPCHSTIRKVRDILIFVMCTLIDISLVWNWEFSFKSLCLESQWKQCLD